MPDLCATFTFPWAVLVPDNARIGVYRGKALLTKRYRDAKAALALVATAQYRGAPLEGNRIVVKAVAFPPDHRRRDIGNLRKGVLDALQGIAYADDYQVCCETWRRGPVDAENPRMELEIFREG